MKAGPVSCESALDPIFQFFCPILCQIYCPQKSNKALEQVVLPKRLVTMKGFFLLSFFRIFESFQGVVCICMHDICWFYPSPRKIRGTEVGLCWDSQT